MVQWLRLLLPVQRTRVQSLLQEDPHVLAQPSPCATTAASTCTAHEPQLLKRIIIIIYHAVKQLKAHTTNHTTIEREVVGTRNIDFIQKASRLRRWWTSILKNRVDQVRIQASFVPKGGEVTGWWKLLGVGILCSCGCPHRSSHDVPVNL